MSTVSSIEWTDRTWNPVRGCSRVSAGCDHCYAMHFAHRFSGPGGVYEGLTVLRPKDARRPGVDWSGRARFVPEMLGEPLRWRKPQKVFVNSMSDLFHESLSNDEIAAVFAVMASCGQHTFQVLTKRPGRAAEWFKWFASGSVGAVERYLASPSMVESRAAREAIGWSEPEPPTAELRHLYDVGAPIVNASLPPSRFHRLSRLGQCHWREWPLSNVWLGVSVDDQVTADERVPQLLQLPAAVRFVSAEPLLGPVDLRTIPANYADAQGDMLDSLSGCEWFDQDTPYGRARPLNPARKGARVDLVIVGGESGPGARPFDAEWARSIVQQCAEAQIAAFVKQLGGSHFAPWKVQWSEASDGAFNAHFIAPNGVVHADLATVWPNGVWHTWDANGTGGENSSAPTVELAKRDALLALQRQHITPIKGWARHPHMLESRKGSDMAEWPEELRVREFPKERA